MTAAGRATRREARSGTTIGCTTTKERSALHAGPAAVPSIPALPPALRTCPSISMLVMIDGSTAARSASTPARPHARQLGADGCCVIISNRSHRVRGHNLGVGEANTLTSLRAWASLLRQPVARVSRLTGCARTWRAFGLEAGTRVAAPVLSWYGNGVSSVRLELFLPVWPRGSARRLFHVG